MTEPGVEEFEAALARHASERGEVYPSALNLIAAEEHWTGRVWEVARLVMAEQESMRYLAGGNRPDEVAECVARWTDSGLPLEEIEMILASGGYDPDPFVPLARAGLLRSALQLADGTTRLIDGERAGAWISDTLALATGQQIVATVEHAIDVAVTAD